MVPLFITDGSGKQSKSLQRVLKAEHEQFEIPTAYLHISVGSSSEHLSADLPPVTIPIDGFYKPRTHEEARSSVRPVQVTVVNADASLTEPFQR